jgi:hypothetical protein
MSGIDGINEYKEELSDSTDLDTSRTYYGNCIICLEGLYKDENRMFLPCSHQYHDSCIRPWLKTQTVCPNCKVSIYVRIDEENPDKIPDEYMNPEDARTMSEVLRERQEQQDILDQIQGGSVGLANVQMVQNYNLANRTDSNQRLHDSISGILDNIMASSFAESSPVSANIIFNIITDLFNTIENNSQNNDVPDSDDVPDDDELPELIDDDISL